MSGKLKEALEADFPDKVDIAVAPVEDGGPRGKVYTISINGDSFFSMETKSDTSIAKAPNDGWKTPLNFETHETYFGPGKGQPGGEAKDKMYEDLKAAIAAKA